jgi:hypothetical protein
VVVEAVVFGLGETFGEDGAVRVRCGAWRYPHDPNAGTPQIASLVEPAGELDGG